MEFHHFISKRDMYPEECEIVKDLIKEMSEVQFDYLGKLPSHCMLKGVTNSIF